MMGNISNNRILNNIPSKTPSLPNRIKSYNIIINDK